MKRITISLPDDLADRIARESRIRRKTVSEIVRSSLSKDFNADETTRRKVPFAGIASGGGSWSAANLDEELKKTWADDIRRGWDK